MVAVTVGSRVSVSGSSISTSSSGRGTSSGARRAVGAGIMATGSCGDCRIIKNSRDTSEMVAGGVAEKIIRVRVAELKIVIHGPWLCLTGLEDQDYTTIYFNST